MPATAKSNLSPRTLTTLKERLRRLEYNMQTVKEKFVEVPSRKAVIRLAKGLPVYSLEEDGSGISFEMVKYELREPNTDGIILTRTIPNGRTNNIEGATLLDLLGNKWFIEIDVHEKEKEEPKNKPVVPTVEVEIKGANTYREDVRAGDEVFIDGSQMEDDSFYIRNQWTTVEEVKDGYVTGLVKYRANNGTSEEKRYTARIEPRFILRTRKAEGKVK